MYVLVYTKNILWTLSLPEAIVFYVSIFLIALAFFQLARKWPALMVTWESIESKLPPLKTEMQKAALAHRIKMITLVATVCSVGECVIASSKHRSFALVLILFFYFSFSFSFWILLFSSSIWMEKWSIYLACWALYITWMAALPCQDIRFRVFSSPIGRNFSTSLNTPTLRASLAKCWMWYRRLHGILMIFLWWQWVWRSRHVSAN